MSFPSAGLKLLLTADNVDGAQNRLLRHGEKVPFWKQQVAGEAADFDTSQPIGVNLKQQPRFLSCADEQAVQFDGMSETLISPGSASKLRFLHAEPEIFDLLIVFRPQSCSVAQVASSGSPKRVFGNSSGSGPGLTVSQSDSSHGKEGQLHIDANNGSTLTSYDFVDKTPPLGKISKFLLRGTGSKILGSFDFLHFEGFAFTPQVTPTDSENDFCLASHTLADTYFTLWGGSIFALGIWNAPQDPLALQAAIDALVGPGV